MNETPINQPGNCHISYPLATISFYLTAILIFVSFDKLSCSLSSLHFTSDSTVLNPLRKQCTSQKQYTQETNMTSIKTFFTNLKEDAGLITNTIHRETFIQTSNSPQTYAITSLVITSFLCISILHIIFLKFVKANKDKLQLKDNNTEVQKAAYQFTNMAVNLALGVYGSYSIYNAPDPLALIFPWNEPDFIKRITGYTHLYKFFAFQLGYNLWALPVGIFKVAEQPTMILHHFSVLTSTVLGSYTNIRYSIYSVYIFGMAELSSVPLAIMNLLKDRKEWTKQNFAVGFAIVKVWFATSFLTLRVLIPTPMIMDLLRSKGLVFLTMTFWKQTEFIDGTESFGSVKIGICLLDFVMSACLGFLQYYWASLVVSGLAKMVPGANKSKRE